MPAIGCGGSFTVCSSAKAEIRRRRGRQTEPWDRWMGRLFPFLAPQPMRNRDPGGWIADSVRAGECTEKSRVQVLSMDTGRRIGDTSGKELRMWNWLIRLWRQFDAWIHHRPSPQPYYRSNLHGRCR